MTTIASLNADHVDAQPREVSGPRGHFLLGNTRAFQRDALGFLQSLAEYGDVARYQLGNIPFYQINHPDGVQQVLQDNNHNYVKGEFFDPVRIFGGNGLFTSEGAFWLRQRRFMQPVFHRKRIAGFATIMTGRAREMLARWDQVAPGQPLDIAEEMTGLTMAVVTEALFGTRFAGATHAVSDAITVALENINFRYHYPFYPSLRWPTPRNRKAAAALHTLDQTVHAIIAERRRHAGEHGDLLDLLMYALDEDTGAMMDDKQFRDEVVTLFVAGHETTAVTLTWTSMLVAQHPDAERRLHAEVDTVLGGRVPSMEDVPALRYTRMVIDETLRLYPPIWITNRTSMAEDAVCGYCIPGGAAVSISSYVIHRLAAYWPDPDRFDPGRFAPGSEETRPHYAYFPFGGGPRQCIGNTFALVEATLVLATIAQRYRLRLPAGQTVTPALSATLRPAGGLPMLLEKRDG